MNHDRRSLFATPRVAHVSLRGVVERPSFATAEPRRIVCPVADLCRAPEGARDRQVLWGHRVEMLETQGDWAFVRAVSDGYVGWIQAEALGQDNAATHRVSALATHRYPAPDLKQRELGWLSLGAEVTVHGCQGTWADTDAGQIPAQHLSPLDAGVPDWVAVAEAHLGVPYLWGGNSSAGLDCSGLVQAALRAAGLPCPGDSDQQQANVGAPVEGPIQRGDLFFWPGHVAIAVDGARLIHANAHAMATCYEPIPEALARIAAAESPLTVRKRL